MICLYSSYNDSITLLSDNTCGSFVRIFLINHAVGVLCRRVSDSEFMFALVICAVTLTQLNGVEFLMEKSNSQQARIYMALLGSMSKRVDILLHMNWHRRLWHFHRCLRRHHHWQWHVECASKSLEHTPVPLLINLGKILLCSQIS